MAKRSSSLFSPTRHHALRRNSSSSAMSPSSAPWSRKENALLVQAWRDVAEHPCAALESVDAFQTRLFLRFQEVSGVGNGSTNDDDDAVSMAGSECSMESLDGSDGGAYFARAVRTQTSVVLKTYALRRMAGFIADFVAKQEQKRIQLLEKEKMQTTDGEEVEMREAESEEQSQEAEEEDSKPVNWFALSKNDQIERFQKAGASNYIELDEHMYTTIQTILELQDKCKQEAPAASGVNNNVSGGSALTPQNPWSEKEVRHVLDAWRDSHLRTPTKLPGGDSFYARFIARNGENSQRSKPEVADTKIALMNMQRVISAFHNRAPTNGKITRGNLKRQRHNWFTLSLTEKEQAFAEGGSNQGCRFVDISEVMYETVSDLMGSSSVPMPSSSFSSSSSSSSSGGGGDVTPEPSKRRSIQTKVGTSNASSDMTSHSIQAETIDLISDDDSSIEDENGEEKTASVETVPASSHGNGDAAEDGGDVDMEENKKGGMSADAAVAASSAETSTPAGLVNTGSGGDLNPGGDADEDRDAGLDVTADADDHGLDASMESDEELKEAAQTHKTTKNDVESRTESEDCCKDAASSRSLGDGDIASSLEAADIDSINKELEAIDRVASFELELTSPLKRQKLEDPEVAAMLREIKKQAQHLNNLVRQVQSERDQEREEREKLLKAIKVDQHGREAVLKLLRIEQDERRRDRDERHKVLQILLQEQQKRGKEQQCDNTKFKIKDEDTH